MFMQAEEELGYFGGVEGGSVYDGVYGWSGLV